MDLRFFSMPPTARTTILPPRKRNKQEEPSDAFRRRVFLGTQNTVTHPQAPDDHNLSSKSDSSVSMVTVIYILTLNTFHQEVEIPIKFWDNKLQDS